MFLNRGTETLTSQLLKVASLNNLNPYNNGAVETTIFTKIRFTNLIALSAFTSIILMEQVETLSFPMKMVEPASNSQLLINKTLFKTNLDNILQLLCTKLGIIIIQNDLKWKSKKTHLLRNRHNKLKKAKVTLKILAMKLHLSLLIYSNRKHMNWKRLVNLEKWVFQDMIRSELSHHYRKDMIIWLWEVVLRIWVGLFLIIILVQEVWLICNHIILFGFLIQNG